MNVEDSVCILCRQTDGDVEQCGLVLGVFPTLDTAKSFAESMEHAPANDWQPPRPGKRRWVLSHNHYVFTIEEHPIKTENPRLEAPATHLATD
jgi:hypothetical protein